VGHEVKYSIALKHVQSTDRESLSSRAQEESRAAADGEGGRDEGKRKSQADGRLIWLWLPLPSRCALALSARARRPSRTVDADSPDGLRIPRPHMSPCSARCRAATCRLPPRPLASTPRSPPSSSAVRSAVLASSPEAARAHTRINSQSAPAFLYLAMRYGLRMRRALKPLRHVPLVQLHPCARASSWMKRALICFVAA
jgi:hypothetical protein